ncbi:hypothetical protein AB0J63_07475 [Streptosporangium canum]|uniref:hypothetical protein n=1 Tax=Streptosporangium canum TaxID=324952 RepID=UPI003435164D
MTGALGYHVAEAMGVPSMGVHLQPIDPTGDFPPVMSLFHRSLGRWGNRRAARLTFELPAAGPLLAGMSTKMRARLGLPPMTPRALYQRREGTRRPIFPGGPVCRAVRLGPGACGTGPQARLSGCGVQVFLAWATPPASM